MEYARAVGTRHPPSLVRRPLSRVREAGTWPWARFLCPPGWATWLIPWGLGSPLEVEILPTTWFPSRNQAGSSETGSELQARKPGVPRTPWSCPLPVHAWLWVLISACAPPLQTHTRHPVAEHSTKRSIIR